jgi:histidinol-phosphate aminotransferase
MGIKIKSPDQDWVHSFLCESLIEAKAYAIDTPDVTIKLDQNESPWDWPEDLKQRVLEKLNASEWNRYPSAFAPRLCELVGEYLEVPAKNILLAPGSNYLCALVLSVFSKRIQGDIVIAQPSFPLYESHCRYEGIDYKVWPLNDDLEYDLKLLPELKPNSLVIFASPNNPVGNVLPYRDLESLLQKHPSTLFIADEAYYEFSSEPYTPLLEAHANLILMRTFSKTMGSAGLRLGYLLASETYLEQIIKLRLPFLLNHFSIVAAETILEDPKGRQVLKVRVQQSIEARDGMFERVQGLSERLGFKVRKSYANFLLLRFESGERCQKAYDHLIKDKILVRNVSKGPGLAGCLRATIGTDKENQALLDSLDRLN